MLMQKISVIHGGLRLWFHQRNKRVTALSKQMCFGGLVMVEPSSKKTWANFLRFDQIGLIEPEPKLKNFFWEFLEFSENF